MNIQVIKGWIIGDSVVYDKCFKQPTKNSSFTTLPLLMYPHTNVGLWITHNLKWDHHINKSVQKCSTLLGLLKPLKFKLNRPVLEKIFLSYIRPIIEYADIVWSGAPFSLLAKFDNVIVEAMRLITGAPARSNIANLYQESGWQLT